MPVFHKWSVTCALGGLALVALAILAGAISIAPGHQAGAADAGTALDFNGSNQYVTFGTALGSRNGSAVATPAWVTGYPFPSPPPINNALQFNGSSQYVTFGRAPSLGATSFTLETGFRREGTGMAATTGALTAIPLVTKGRGEADGSNVDMNYFLGIRSSDNVLAADFEDNVNGGNHVVTGTTAIPVSPATWHHAAATYDLATATWKLYLDGNLEASAVATGNTTPRFDSIQHAALASALTSAGVPGTNSPGFFAGSLDEARIWNVARTQSAIQASMNSELVSPATGLIGRWGMNEGAGTLVLDSTSGLWGQTFTIETWFKREGPGAGTTTGTGGIPDAIPLLSKGRAEAEGSNVDMNYILGIRASDSVLVADFEEGAGQTVPGANHPVIGATVATSNVWHHAAATYAGTTWRLFLDGNEDATLAVGRSPRCDSIQHAAFATAVNSPGTAAGLFNCAIDE